MDRNQEKHIVQVSKLLSFVLRHKPEAIGLVLDAEGWTSIDDLVAKGSTGKLKFDRTVVLHIVANCDKQRYSMSEDGQLIRANQGHSVKDVHTVGDATEPPAILYHGTAERLVPLIIAEGIKPMSRQHVHLSADNETAVTVGKRHGKPVILVVNSGQMHADGIKFYKSDNDVWLCSDTINLKYLLNR